MNSHKVCYNPTFGQETAPELTVMLPEAEVCFYLSQWTLPFALKQIAAYGFAATEHFFFSGVQFADVVLDMLHIFKLISAPP